MLLSLLRSAPGTSLFALLFVATVLYLVVA